MNLFFDVRSSDHANPVRRVLREVSKKVGHAVQESADGADLIVTDSALEAVACLRQHPTAKIVVAAVTSDSPEGVGARSLREEHADRIFLKPLLEKEGEENLVHFLMRIKTPEDVA